MSKVALITGITGQDGSILAEFLLGKDYIVHGIKRRSSSFNTQRIDHLVGKKNFYLHYGDITDGGCLLDVIDRTHPDEIYHLAAQSHVKVSFEIPEYTCDVVALGTLRLFEAVLRIGNLNSVEPKPRIYNACSSEMFGDVLEIPQTESTPFNPRSPYACAKVFSFNIAKNYRESYGMFISNGILFNHEQPGLRGETFVTRKISMAVAKIKRGMQDVLQLGNLSSKRDWGLASEYVEAMWLMLQHNKPDDFVIATGETHTVREFCEIAFNYVGLDWKNYVEINPKYIRPSEVDILIGDASKAKRFLGWEAKTKFEDLVKMMVLYDLNIIDGRI